MGIFSNNKHDRLQVLPVVVKEGTDIVTVKGVALHLRYKGWGIQIPSDTDEPVCLVPS